jgi:hypothetical protein
VWLTRREIDRACELSCELSCDEAVIRDSDESGKHSYGETLLYIAADTLKGTGGKTPRAVLSTTMCEEKKALKERLAAIIKAKKRTRAALVASVALVIVAVPAACAPGAGNRARTVDEIIGSDDPRFRGLVEEVYEKSILVRVYEDEDIRKSSDLIDVLLVNANPDANSGYEVGDEVCVYFDGTIAESYPAKVSAYAVLIENRTAVGIIPDGLNVPDAVLTAAVDWVRSDYAGSRDIGSINANKDKGAEFDNRRIDYIEHVYSYDDMNIDVYRFEWRVHTTTPDKIQPAGGEEIDADGRFLDNYPHSWYLYLEGRDGELFCLFAMMENDCAPGDEAFTRDMLNRLATDNQDTSSLSDEQLASGIFAVLMELYELDPGLNYGLKYIAADLTPLPERAHRPLTALLRPFASDMGCELLLSSYITVA